MTGTGRLIRLILRRDRWLLPLWVIVIGLLPMTYVTSFRSLFPTAADLQRYADSSMNSSAFVSLYGRLTGPSLGELASWRAGFIPVVVALFSLLTVIRHTRTEEESGRRELIGSTVVGRHAGLAAALVTTCVANLVLALVVAVTMAGQGVPAAGGLALGLEFAIAGCVFAAVGAVAAQLTPGAGGARGVAIIALGIAYVLRVVGDLSGLAGVRCPGSRGCRRWVWPSGSTRSAGSAGGCSPSRPRSPRCSARWP
ncbi:hypothetical protein [Plantactinospora sp. KBS50]|uniref:hypothetical protein n=1 Tax=Plantactinospora sp. KBS50 TaxID=2024580 RepID=UPI001E38C3A5|nr:hypothetical protein [Plantactinospora sp. KBS50]